LWRQCPRRCEGLDSGERVFGNGSLRIDAGRFARLRARKVQDVHRVTLALAAEDHMPDSDAVYLYKQLEQRVSKSEIKIFNVLRNWLKHYIEPDDFEFSDFEAAIAVFRATSKFFATYRKSSPKMESFVAWCQTKKLIEPRTAF
jgi:hypothetical protein